MAIKPATAATATESASGASAEIHIDLGDGLMVADEESIARFAAEKGADAVIAGLDAMAAKFAALKATALAAKAGMAPPSAMGMKAASRIGAHR